MTSSECDGSRESFDSNAVEANGIFIEVTNPSPRFYPTPVFPIPKNLLGSHTSIQVTLRIINNTSTSFRLNPSQTFIPEVWASDRQTRQRLRDIDCLAASTHPNRFFDREATSGLAGLRPNAGPCDRTQRDEKF